jgi:2',3'-cyclic-nucleotide 2'-phosphodiesterase (5'-nucleotidase family)
VVLIWKWKLSEAFLVGTAPQDNGNPSTGSSSTTTTSTTSRLFVAKKRTGGGRAPGQVDQIGEEAPREWRPTPCDPSEARLTVVQITDTYTLEHLPSVKTMLQDIREKSKGSTVISCMTGDFLAPYLLSSVDRGQGMMNALASIPIDYVTWGNHEVRL